MIPYTVGKLTPNSTHSTRELVKYVPGRGYFRAIPSQNGGIIVTSPPPSIVERVNMPRHDTVDPMLHTYTHILTYTYTCYY